MFGKSPKIVLLPVCVSASAELEPRRHLYESSVLQDNLAADRGRILLDMRRSQSLGACCSDICAADLVVGTTPSGR